MKVPTTDSIRELAEFWDTHDLTKFEDDLEEAQERVFERQTGHSVRVPLTDEERRAIQEMAAARGVRADVLIREWVREKLDHP
jgi:hypothetical protein